MLNLIYYFSDLLYYSILFYSSIMFPSVNNRHHISCMKQCIGLNSVQSCKVHFGDDQQADEESWEVLLLSKTKQTITVLIKSIHPPHILGVTVTK